jgi:hypothetical protein
MSDYKHPVSGEPITLGEHISWRIQFAIRRWSFLGIITGITITCCILGTTHPNVLVWWNIWASFMALVIESVVGMAMFNMAQNDGRVIRKILEMESSQFSELKDLLERVEEDLDIYHDEAPDDDVV